MDDVDSNDIPEPNHSWNVSMSFPIHFFLIFVVELDGEIRFVDVALGCPSHPFNSGRSGVQYFYFMALPSQFIFTHFPSDPSLQYLSQEVPADVFYALPFVTPTYFECGFSPINIRGTVFLFEGSSGLAGLI